MADLSSVVVDTNSIVWYAAQKHRKLSTTARLVFERFEARQCALFVPTPVLQELWFLSLNATIVAKPTFRRWWQRLECDTLVEVALEHCDILEASELPWAHRDPIDRMIVAIARRVDLPLLTADEAIRDFKGVDTVW